LTEFKHLPRYLPELKVGIIIETSGVPCPII
jgi:hypothetical protein